MSKEIKNNPQTYFSLPHIKPKLKKSSSQPKTTRDHEQTVKLFEEKLISHKQQIDKNAVVTRMLNSQFDQLKQQLKQERFLSESYLLDKKLLEESHAITLAEMAALNVSYEKIKEQYQAECTAHSLLKDRVAKEVRSKSSKVSDLEKSLQTLQNEIDELAQENIILKQKVSEEEQQKQKVASNVETYLNQMRSIRKVNLDLVTHIQNQQNQILMKEKQLRQVREKTHRQAIDNKLLKLLHEKEDVASQLSKLKQSYASLDQQKKQSISDYEAKLKDKKKEYKDMITMNDTQIKSLNHKYQQQINSLKVKSEQLQNIIVCAEKLKENQKRIKGLLACTFCKQTLKEPVTTIPCGHSFCINCKKGYQKECSKCGSKMKIQAIYRNELLDQIVALLKTVEEATGFITGINTKAQ